MGDIEITLGFHDFRSGGDWGLLIYGFGDFSLDSATYELRKNGQLVSIEPQVFNLLVYLVEHRDQMVSRDDIITAVWDGRFVSDTTLSSGIFALRRTLGDTGEAQKVIRTVPRRGFRFVADIIPAAASPSNESGDIKEPNEASINITTPTAFGALELKTDNLRHDRPQTTILPKLAVLPFKISSAGLDEYFCNGLTEDIISNLTSFSELRVIASGSSFQFNDRAIPLPEIAKKLDVDYIVDGSVRLDGGRLRIAVQLIEAATGVSLWADRYDRQMEEIFEVQDAMTHMVAATLGVKLQSAALTRALAKSPTELHAYDCLLRARRYTGTLYEDMHAEARDLLEKAVSLDPNYAEAHALLANVYLAEHRFDTNPLPYPIERALKSALKAVQLDPQSAYAHCWLAITHYFRKDIGKFEAEIQRALDLNPHDPEILAESGHYFCFNGEIERGVELSKQAQELNPLHPGWYHFSSALLHYHQGRYEDMLADVQRISMPTFYWTHILNAAALGQMGDKEASASLDLMHKVKPGISAASAMHKWVASKRDYDHIMEGLRKAGHDE